MKPKTGNKREWNAVSGVPGKTGSLSFLLIGTEKTYIKFYNEILTIPFSSGGNTTLQTSWTETGTKPNYEAVGGMGKMNENDIQTKSNEITKSNFYIQEFQSKDNQKFSSLSTTKLPRVWN
jgi:hypothetical protein